MAWFMLIRPVHRQRYREAIADLPRWDLRADWLATPRRHSP